MGLLFDLAKMTVSSAPGNGSTIALGAAANVNGVQFLSFASAGVTNGAVVDYSILDSGAGGASEIGTATYSTSGPSLTGRTPTISTAGVGTAINASAASIVSISPRAETLNNASLFTTGILNAAVVPLNGVVQINQYASSQTITIPASATRAYIHLWGGSGGAGPAASIGCVVVGGNGGAGAGYLEKYLTNLTGGDTLALTVGAAGSANGAGGASSLASGTQTITTLTTNGGSAGGTVTGAPGAGGTANNGDFQATGQRGGFGISATGATVEQGGSGGMSGGGRSAGGNGGTGTGAVGVVGGCNIFWLS